jgi:hypothetical protein
MQPRDAKQLTRRSYNLRCARNQMFYRASPERPPTADHNNQAQCYQNNFSGKYVSNSRIENPKLSFAII